MKRIDEGALIATITIATLMGFNVIKWSWWLLFSPFILGWFWNLFVDIANNKEERR